MPANGDASHLLDLALDAARSAGADAAALLLVERRSLEVSWRMGDLEELERKEDRDIGLRVFVGRRQACASTSQLDPDTLAGFVRELVESARHLPEDPFAGLAPPAQLARELPELDLVDPEEPSPEELLRAAAAAEDAARGVAGVTNSDGASAGWSMTTVHLAASNGLDARYRRTSHRLGATVLVGAGTAMERDGEHRSATHRGDLPSPEEIGRIAGERTAKRIGARKIASQKAPVIFENRLAGRIISPFFSAISGSAVARGVSFLKDKMGERIFAEGFRIHEDPFVKRLPSSHWFDGEGSAVSAHTLIDDGVLTMWLLNSSAAKQLNLEPNGHATAGHGGPPGIGTSNLFVKPGTEDLATMMKNAGKGVFVTDMFSPSLNPNTADWSVGVSGYWFENGEIAHPVSEITVAGNLLDIFKRLRTGSDVDNRGSLEISSLIVDDLAIGGV